MDYFKLGVVGEGYALFLPDSYNKSEKVIGSGIRRTISGKAKRDIITTKHTITLGFENINSLEVANLYAQFDKNINMGKNLTFIDDEGNSFLVMWGDAFGIEERGKFEEIYWSGSIILEEI